MGYDPNKGKEISGLPPDKAFDGVITAVHDGKVGDFILNPESWQGDIKQEAINIVVEIKDVSEFTQFEQIMTYHEKNGKIEYHKMSNMGKFNRKYDTLPAAGIKVSVYTTGEGFAKIKLD